MKMLELAKMLAVLLLSGPMTAVAATDADTVVLTRRFGPQTCPTCIGAQTYTEINPGQRFMYGIYSAFQSGLDGYSTTAVIEFPDAVVPAVGVYPAPYVQVVGSTVRIQDPNNGGLFINLPFDVKPVAQLPGGATEIRMRISITVVTPSGTFENMVEDVLDIAGDLAAAAIAEPAEVDLDAATPITVTIRLRNTGGSALMHAAPADDPTVAGSGLAERIAGPTPTDLALAVGAFGDIVYTYKPTKAGRVAFSFSGFLAQGAAGVVRAGPVTTNEVAIVSGGLRVTTTGDEPLPAQARTDRVCDVAPNLDGNQCTLRAALELAEHLGGARAITFDIPGGGVPRIAPGRALPALIGPTTLDGTTQPGGWVELMGPADETAGITVTGDGASVRGLVLGNWSTAIAVSAGGGHLIRGNRIGTDAAGSSARPNDVGIDVDDGSVTIGGTAGLATSACTGDCNLISGNRQVGVLVSGDAIIIGNSIGTDAAGANPVGNFRGVWVTGAGHAQIGGAADMPGTGAGNLISGNALNGIRVENGSAVVQGNVIGLDRSGARALAPADAHPTQHAGVVLAQLGGDLVVGGVERAEGNVIGGFVGDATPAGPGDQPEGQAGIYVASGSANIRNNRIGTDRSGRVAVPNLYGIVTRRALTPDDLPGLPVALIDENLVSGNLSDGVLGGGRVAGNRIGTDAAGLHALPNGGNGVSDAREVGGLRPDGSTTCEYPCNLISGNGQAAVSSSNVVLGNFIGTDVTGRMAIPNNTREGPAAVFTSGSVGGESGAVVDGTCDAACNLIAGNRAAGVRASVVQGNVIGATIDLQPLPNASGVLVDVVPVQIGGDPAHGNRITFNRERAVFGVAVPPLAPTRFEVVTNVITGNGDGFVGLTGDGAPTTQAVFGGPFYETRIDVAQRRDNGIVIEGRVLDLPTIRTSDVRVEMYGAQSCEPGNQPEHPLADRLLGPLSDGSFQSTALADPKYRFVMAIATYGGFSRWPSQCVAVAGSGCASGATLDSVGCRLRDLDDAASGLGSSKPAKKLRARLAAAGKAVDRAYAQLEKGKTGPAKKALRKAGSAVQAVEKLLRSKKLVDAVPAEVRNRIATQLATLKADLRTLQRAPAL